MTEPVGRPAPRTACPSEVPANAIRPQHSRAAETGNDPAEIHLVYLAGASHSGSTLLELLLSAHSQLTGLGELKALTDSRPAKRARVLAQPCTCGAPRKAACRFWAAVDEQVEERLGIGLAGLDLESGDDRTFVSHNRALLEAAAGASGVRWLVDSSKRPERLQRIAASGIAIVHPVRIDRDARGVVHSQVAKGRSFTRSLARHVAARRRLERARRALRGGGDALHSLHSLRYEDLSDAPEATLRTLMTRLGLSYEPAQLAWTSVSHHLLCGNHMRFAKTPRIERDERWRTGLSPLQRVAVRWLAGGSATSDQPHRISR